MDCWSANEPGAKFGPNCSLIWKVPRRFLQSSFNLVPSGGFFEWIWAERLLSQTHYCLWNFLPFSADNCPDRLFLSSLAVAHDAAVGVPPVASETLTMGVEYSLVSVVYLILGGCHYVTQFRLRGKWLKYDCTAGGSTSASASFDRRWHCGRQVLYVYVKTDLLVVSAPVSALPSSVP